MTDHDRAMYRIDEVAKLFGVSRRTVWYWIAAGRVEIMRMGPRSIRISANEVLRLVAEGRTPQTPRRHPVNIP